MQYNLEERTASFAEKIIDLCKKIKVTPVTAPLISQLTCAGTSIGANYCEANAASSKKDFNNKIHICKRESAETKYWLRIIAKAEESIKEGCRALWKEAQEFTLIFSKITGTIKKNKN